MAKLVATKPIDMGAFDFGSFLSSPDATIQTDLKTTIQVDFPNGDRHLFLGSFGVNIFARSISGNATSWKYSNELSHEDFFVLSEAKIPAAKVLKAAQTAALTDDLAVIIDVFKGSDSIQGSAFADVLNGYKGNDTIGAGAGDTVNGGDTKDKDVVTFAEATGAVGVTLIKGVQTAFTVAGSASGLIVNVESVVGSAHSDTITGDIDANSLKGEGDDDLIDGGAGNDTVDGGAGNDTIVGGAGKDVLTGGGDADTFRFLAITDVPKGELVTDFVAGVDKLDLSAIDAIKSNGAGDDFFILDGPGTSKSPVAEGHISWYVVNKTGETNDRTYIRINVDANAKIDMTIELKGALTLTGADFFL